MAMVGRLDGDARAAIGRELRRMYTDIIAEGVPERFAEILRKLDEPTPPTQANDANST
jgi:Anti-sigma factor NepR